MAGLDHVMGAITRAVQDYTRAVGEAIARVGLAGGGHVYAESMQTAHDADGLRVAYRIWEVPVGAAAPVDLPACHAYVVHVVPAMFRG